MIIFIFIISAISHMLMILVSSLIDLFWTFHLDISQTLQIQCPKLNPFAIQKICPYSFLAPPSIHVTAQARNALVNLDSYLYLHI